MGYTVVTDIVCMNLNSIFNIASAIKTTYRFLANKNSKL